ncbi:MAG: hypothetical protein IJU52_03030 [Clostridia bacterium]|nr:hypothetical protein [Clostridia bacterium]
MRFFRKALCVISVLVLTLPTCLFTASGNSAQLYWGGTTAAGTAVLEEDCPLEIESELLTFDIPAFPENRYSADSKEAISGYLSQTRVTAEYTFYNPASYDVTATLAFPFGKTPDYIEAKDVSGEAWGARIDGKPVQTKIRHTFSRSRYTNDDDPKRLLGEYKSDPFFTPDLPVTFFSYAYVSEKQDGSDQVEFTVYKDPGMRFSCLWNSNDDRGDRLTFSGMLYAQSPERTLDFVFFGNAPDGIVFENLHEGEMRRLPEKTRTTTLRALAFEDYDPAFGVSETDWYNAYVDRLLENEKSDFCRYDVMHLLTYDLMTWYVYEMTVPAGGRVKNAVTAPLFPAIDGEYEPPVYEYSYLLSPAKTWKAFGELKVVVNTPFYMTDSGVGDFLSADGGYTRSFDGLPDGELTFSLSSDRSPRRNTKFIRTLIFLALYFLALFLLCGGITAAVIVTVRAVIRKRKKTKGASL